ncbi:hypothetical protein QFZ36_002574 [Pseudarthrobacter siccitolerans]|uniref:Uncharacterized protein n=1 Tax=Pseudarthrobacter siccitolerans TaxID=861266 RepID=A0ABU0PM18_9MICC|nr:hypothetical protein [Pseudarthrobacter siccitolerans]MDQ0675013.1 hypothetical protein [Pseudarthrobacter siccitolerans]
MRAPARLLPREPQQFRLPAAAQAFPLTAAVAGPMGRYDSGDHYELVLGLLLKGMAGNI